MSNGGIKFASMRLASLTDSLAFLVAVLNSCMLMITMSEGSLALWVSTAATLVVSFIALFKESILGKFYKPQLTLKTGTESPFCVQTPTTVRWLTEEGVRAWSGQFYWSRVLVENSGNRRAENVEVFVKSVAKMEISSNKYTPHPEFIPSNLRWANTDSQNPEIYTDLNPGMGRYCDLGSVADPACPTLRELPDAKMGTATFDLVLKHALPKDAHRLPPGTYRITVVLCAANCAPSSTDVEVRISGGWTEDEGIMRSKHLGIMLA